MNNPSDIGREAQAAFQADMKPVLDAFRDVLATHFYQAGCTKRIFEITDNLEQLVAIASLHVKIGHIDHERSAIRRVNAILSGEESAMADLISVEDVSPVIGDQVAPLRRVNTGSGRHYYTITDDGIKFYASWTTVIKRICGTSEHLVKWIADKGYDESRAYMEERAHYGTIMHIIIGKFLEKGSYRIEAVHSEASMYLFNNKLDISLAEQWTPELKSDLLAFAQWVADKDVEVIACELPLTYNWAGIAGTIDLVCNLTFNKQRVRAIVDFKSGRKGFFAEHKYQLHGYRMMWNENFPETPIDMVFNWSPKDWTKAPSYNFENQTDAPERHALLGLLAQHAVLFPDSKPRPVRSITGTVTLGQPTTENFEFVEVEAFLRAKHGIDNVQ